MLAKISKFNLLGFIIVIFFLFGCEKVIWREEVPFRFHGEWYLIEDYFTGSYGINIIQISTSKIALTYIQDDGNTEIREFPIHKISFNNPLESESGEMVIFYGDLAEDTITRYRIQVLYGTKKKLIVYQILPTGWGEDRLFKVGEFVKFDLK